MSPLTIPILKSSVAATPLPAARIRGGQVGADPVLGEIGRLGGQVGQLGRTVQSVETEEQRIADAQEKARAKYQDEVDKLKATSLLTGFKDQLRNKRAEYTGMTGVNAVGLLEKANKDIDDIKRDVLSNSENNRQTELVEAATISHREALLDFVSGHETKEHFATQTANAEAEMSNSIIVAGDINSTDLDRKLAEEGLIDSLVVLTKGMTPPQVKNFKTEAWSNFYSDRINVLAPVDATAAQEFYNKVQKDLTPDDREDLQKVLTDQSTYQDARAVVEDTVLTVKDRTDWKQAVRDATYTGTKEEQAAKIKEAESQINDRITEAETKDKVLKEANYKNQFSKAVDIVSTGDLKGAIRATKELTDPIEQQKAESSIRALYKAQTEPPTTNRRVLMKDVFEGIDNGTIKDRIDILGFSEWLNESDFREAERRLTAKKKTDNGVKVGEVKLSTAKAAIAAVNERSFNYEDDSKTLDIVLKELTPLANKKGDDLSPVEALDATSSIMMKGELTGTGIIWSDKMTRIEAEQSGNIDIWLPLINDDDIDNGQELRSIQEWSVAKLGVSDPSDELMGLIKREGVMGIDLSEAQNARFNELIAKERDR